MTMTDNGKDERGVWFADKFSDLAEESIRQGMDWGEFVGNVMWRVFAGLRALGLSESGARRYFDVVLSEVYLFNEVDTPSFRWGRKPRFSFVCFNSIILLTFPI